jgi:hypothetical protein
MKVARSCKGKKLNKPFKSDRKFKKRQVCVKEGEKVINVHYGDKRYRHNYSKKARKSFRARHRCSSAKDKTSARYWACKDLW